MEKLTTEPGSGTIDYRPKIWGRQNLGVRVEHYLGKGNLPVDRRKKHPEYNAAKDGNVYEWLYNTVIARRKLMEQGRRVTDQPRMKKL